MQPWQPVLRFWFGQSEKPDQTYMKRWFSGGEETDKAIQDAFADLHAELHQNVPESWQTDAEALCAAIIVLDQFSRNLYRGQAAAFASDEQACRLTKTGLQQGLFSSLPAVWQAFALMPLMHSESLTDHQLCLRAFADLQAQFPDDEILTGFISSAQQHHDIIQQFGRYPHRNDVLNRPSTEDEIHYLANGAQRFGQ